MQMTRKTLAWGAASLLGAVLLATAIRLRKNPSACPYGQRLILELPRPFLTRSGLRSMLAPAPGDRVLEVGPGTGYYALPAARWLEPNGSLDILDLQQQMLDRTMRRARGLGITNILPARGDASSLPYPDGSFDAAYLVATLGEIPDQEGALGELRRVLRPGGRLVVGEGVPDPHMAPFGRLRERAEAAGLRFERRLGGRLGYFACFRVEHSEEAGKPTVQAPHDRDGGDRRR